MRPPRREETVRGKALVGSGAWLMGGWEGSATRAGQLQLAAVRSYETSVCVGGGAWCV